MAGPGPNDQIHTWLGAVSLLRPNRGQYRQGDRVAAWPDECPLWRERPIIAEKEEIT